MVAFLSFAVRERVRLRRDRDLRREVHHRVLGPLVPELEEERVPAAALPLGRVLHRGRVRVARGGVAVEERRRFLEPQHRVHAALAVDLDRVAAARRDPGDQPEIARLVVERLVVGRYC